MDPHVKKTHAIFTGFAIWQDMFSERILSSVRTIPLFASKAKSSKNILVDPYEARTILFQSIPL
jgi:hypothetical protein